MAPSDWLKTQSYDRILNKHLLKMNNHPLLKKPPTSFSLDISSDILSSIPWKPVVNSVKILQKLITLSMMIRLYKKKFKYCSLIPDYLNVQQ